VSSDVSPGSGGREDLLREVRRRVAVRRHRHHRRLAAAAGVLVAATTVVVVVAVQPGHPPTSIQVQSQGTTVNRPVGASATTARAPATSRPGSAATAATTSTASASAVPAGAPTTSSLPVVICPTTFGVTPSPRPLAQPTAVPTAVPSPLAGRLSIYVDDQGTMGLVGPLGWVCSALYGADGSGGVAVYPSGEPIPSDWGAGWRLPESSGVQAIIGSETSACMGCQVGQACPLFSSAAQDFQSYFGRACPKTGLVAFNDPPGVAGDGIPSGGQNPANGAMTYYSADQNGSWLETCTLPAAEKDMCTVSLDHFTAAYGSK
jgi:hypothetical protein